MSEAKHEVPALTTVAWQHEGAKRTPRVILSDEASLGYELAILVGFSESLQACRPGMSFILTKDGIRVLQRTIDAEIEHFAMSRGKRQAQRIVDENSDSEPDMGSAR